MVEKIPNDPKLAWETGYNEAMNSMASLMDEIYPKLDSSTKTYLIGKYQLILENYQKSESFSFSTNKKPEFKCGHKNYIEYSYDLDEWLCSRCGFDGDIEL